MLHTAWALALQLELLLFLVEHLVILLDFFFNVHSSLFTFYFLRWKDRMVISFKSRVDFNFLPSGKSLQCNLHILILPNFGHVVKNHPIIQEKEWNFPSLCIYHVVSILNLQKIKLKDIKRDIFLFNGFSWPLFYYLLHNSQSLSISLVARSLLMSQVTVFQVTK